LGRQGGQIKALPMQRDEMMRGWFKTGLAWSLMIAAVPASGQIAGGIGVNHSDGEAFIEAIEKGDNNAAIPLIEQPGSGVAKYKNYKGETALHVATRKRELDWVGYLLKKGADPNVGDAQGYTPLMIASSIGFDEAVSWMLQLGANADVANRRGETALIIAVQQRQPRIVELLLKAGANPDKGDHTAGLSARDYAKRDTRNPQLLKLIETIKSTKKQVAGPSVN
jgi:ankyrin repeat protein